MRDYNCEDCGIRAQTKYKNTKYCEVCRIYRNLLFLKNYKQECIECEKTYMPLVKTSYLCGGCDFTKKYAAGECALCNEKSDKLLHEDLKICSVCATDPDKRTLVLRALAKRRRRNKNG